MVSIAAFQAVDPSSILGHRIYFSILFVISLFFYINIIGFIVQHTYEALVV
jgi:hypothetical protein